ncbi:MAG TPA: hypothetical protein VJ957_10320 [Longimicrobiales bacterium]|nr:hypothetical protein [Longimicrobiales bacterium]
MLSTILTLLLVGLAAVVGVSVVLAIIGAIFGIAISLAGFLLFKVAPLILIGYVVVRLIAPRHKRLEGLDRKWIDDE